MEQTLVEPILSLLPLLAGVLALLGHLDRIGGDEAEVKRETRELRKLAIRDRVEVTGTFFNRYSTLDDSFSGSSKEHVEEWWRRLLAIADTEREVRAASHGFFRMRGGYVWVFVIGVLYTIAAFVIKGAFVDFAPHCAVVLILVAVALVLMARRYEGKLRAVGDNPLFLRNE